jgi:hypothetical protein
MIYRLWLWANLMFEIVELVALTAFPTPSAQE